MENPFQALMNRLQSIETILLEIQKHPHHETYSDSNEKLFTVKEAAHFLNLTVPTIYSKVSKGELPYMKRSKRLYFSSMELTSYLKSGSVKTNLELENVANNYIKSS